MDYIKYVLAIGDGSAPAKVIDQINGGQATSIIFAVKSTNLEECKTVADTIAQIFNRFMFTFPTKIAMENIDAEIRNKGDWRDDERSGCLEYTHYVYGYALPKDYETWSVDTGSYRDNLDNYNVFYIGRGQNNRFVDHVQEAIDGLRITKGNGTDEIGKRQKIQQFLLSESFDAGRQLVRKICHFKGRYALAQYAAAEHFLINYCYGVYELENLTRGDQKTRGSDCVWLCRPRRLESGDSVWNEMIREFSTNSGRRKIQKLTCELLVAETNAYFNAFPIQSLPKNITLNSPLAITDGRDAYYSLGLLGQKRETFFHIQLKLSNKETGVRINLRKAADDKPAAFSDRIAKVFFGGNLHEAKKHISIEGKPDAYFKPCTKNSKGKQDTWFDLRSPDDRRYDPRGTPLGRVASSSDFYSFCDALRVLSDLTNK
jgi:hypothetical protein